MSEETSGDTSSGDTSAPPAPNARFRLPHVTQQAVFDLAAPWHTWRSTQDLVRWAERRLRFTADCMDTSHRVQVNPHSGQFSDVFANTDKRRRVEATHMLWNLRHPAPAPPLPCRLFEETLTTWVGAYQPPALRTWNTAWRVRMHALRGIVRTVQYLDAGLDLHEHQRWIELGASVASLGWIRDQSHTAGLTVAAEEEVLDDLVALTALDGRLRRERKDLTQEVLCALADSLIRKQADQPQWPPSRVRPPLRGTGSMRSAAAHASD